MRPRPRRGKPGLFEDEQTDGQCREAEAREHEQEAPSVTARNLALVALMLWKDGLHLPALLSATGMRQLAPLRVN